MLLSYDRYVIIMVLSCDHGFDCSSISAKGGEAIIKMDHSRVHHKLVAAVVEHICHGQSVSSTYSRIESYTHVIGVVLSCLCLG